MGSWLLTTLGLLLMRYHQGQHREMKEHFTQVTYLVTGRPIAPRITPTEGRSVRVLAAHTAMFQYFTRRNDLFTSEIEDHRGRLTKPKNNFQNILTEWNILTPALPMR